MRRDSGIKRTSGRRGFLCAVPGDDEATRGLDISELEICFPSFGLIDASCFRFGLDDALIDSDGRVGVSRGILKSVPRMKHTVCPLSFVSNQLQSCTSFRQLQPFVRRDRMVKHSTGSFLLSLMAHTQIHKKCFVSRPTYLDQKSRHGMEA